MPQQLYSYQNGAVRAILFNAINNNNFVHDVLEFDKGQYIFMSKNTSKFAFSGSRFHSKTLVIRLSESEMYYIFHCKKGDNCDWFL